MPARERFWPALTARDARRDGQPPREDPHPVSVCAGQKANMQAIEVPKENADFYKCLQGIFTDFFFQQNLEALQVNRI